VRIRSITGAFRTAATMLTSREAAGRERHQMAGTRCCWPAASWHSDVSGAWPMTVAHGGEFIHSALRRPLPHRPRATALARYVATCAPGPCGVWSSPCAAVQGALQVHVAGEASVTTVTARADLCDRLARSPRVGQRSCPSVSAMQVRQPRLRAAGTEGVVCSPVQPE
jgi:hypothetical protein